MLLPALQRLLLSARAGSTAVQTLLLHFNTELQHCNPAAAVPDSLTHGISSLDSAYAVDSRAGHSSSSSSSSRTDLWLRPVWHTQLQWQTVAADADAAAQLLPAAGQSGDSSSSSCGWSRRSFSTARAREGSRQCINNTSCRSSWSAGNETNSALLSSSRPDSSSQNEGSRGRGKASPGSGGTDSISSQPSSRYRSSWCAGNGSEADEGGSSRKRRRGGSTGRPSSPGKVMLCAFELLAQVPLLTAVRDWLCSEASAEAVSGRPSLILHWYFMQAF